MKLLQQKKKLLKQKKKLNNKIIEQSLISCLNNFNIGYVIV